MLGWYQPYMPLSNATAASQIHTRIVSGRHAALARRVDVGALLGGF